MNEGTTMDDLAYSMDLIANAASEALLRPHVVPITLRAARDFIAQHHRHSKPPVGWKFGLGLQVGESLVGVATAGRPVARHYDDGKTLEVNRTCTDGTRNANSMLYGAVWRAAKAMGYVRCITYTQHDESGASLRAAGWVKVKTLEARKSWAESSVKLADKRDPVGAGGVARTLWEIRVLPSTLPISGPPSAGPLDWRVGPL